MEEEEEGESRRGGEGIFRPLLATISVPKRLGAWSRNNEKAGTRQQVQRYTVPFTPSSPIDSIFLQAIENLPICRASIQSGKHSEKAARIIPIVCENEWGDK